MKKWLLIAVAVTFGVSSAATAEESFGDLEGSTASKEFTPAERRHFTEALDRYQKYEISNEFKARSITAWLDNDHIVFSARRFPGWEAKPHEPSRIISLNVVTGDFVDSGYRGRLYCLNHLGDMMIRLGGDEAIMYSSTEKYQWLLGKWGGELSYKQRPNGSIVPNYLCQFFSFKDQISSHEMPGETAGIRKRIPLLPEHGYLKEDIRHTNDDEFRIVHHLKPDGSANPVSGAAPQPTFFHFQPWANEYFERGTLTSAPRSFNPSRGFSYIPIPVLLQHWSLNSPVTTASVTATKAGMLWDVHQGKGFWKKQGLYLSTAEGLLKIESGRGVYALTSPNGCRIIDSVVRGNPYQNDSNPYTWLIIDVCKLKK